MLPEKMSSNEQRVRLTLVACPERVSEMPSVNLGTQRTKQPF